MRPKGEPMRTRSVEMYLASVLCGYGGILMAPGATFDIPHYQVINDWVRVFPGSEFRMGAILTTVGLLRWAALIINGWHHATPGARLLGCLVGAMWWTTLSVAFVAVAGLTGPPAAIAWTVSGVIFEWFSISRVISDAFAANSFGIRKWAQRDRSVTNGRGRQHP